MAWPESVKKSTAAAQHSLAMPGQMGLKLVTPSKGGAIPTSTAIGRPIMTKLQTLLVSAASGIAALTLASAAAATVTLTATDSLQTYTNTTGASGSYKTIDIDYTIASPGDEKLLYYALYIDNTIGSSNTTGPLTTSGTYVYGKLYKGFTVEYQLVPVPEPAAWAMMLVGFGGVGAAMRRRGAKAAAAV